jgi:C_GCAxxG_C_C family probable redox protein
LGKGDFIAVSNRDPLESAYQHGFDFEKKYHGCAQCVVAALYEVFPEIKNEDVFRSACGLAAGVGLTLKGQCGGLTGAVMVLSQIYGRELNNLTDPERKRDLAYRLGQKMVKKYLDEYGTLICCEIQEKLMGRSFDLWNPEQKKLFEEMGGHSRVCPSVVGKAVQWATELIVEQRKEPEIHVLQETCERSRG